MPEARVLLCTFSVRAALPNVYLGERRGERSAHVSSLSRHSCLHQKHALRKESVCPVLITCLQSTQYISSRNHTISANQFTCCAEGISSAAENICNGKALSKESEQKSDRLRSVHRPLQQVADRHLQGCRRALCPSPDKLPARTIMTLHLTGARCHTPTM